MNDDVMKMVQDNRACHPGGEKMWLASEQQILLFENKIARAIDAEKAATDRVNDLEFQRRSWHVITAGLCVTFAVVFFFIGLLV